MPQATEAFKLSTFPGKSILIKLSQFSDVKFLSPLSYEPMTKAFFFPKAISL